MRKLFLTILGILAVQAALAQTDESQKYMRGSLCMMMVEHPTLEYNKDIEQVFEKMDTNVSIATTWVYALSASPTTRINRPTSRFSPRTTNWVRSLCRSGSAGTRKPVPSISTW